MKWRPRISIPLGKGIRINLGRRGIGASAGIPGVARIGIGSDGRTRSSIGKGLFRWEHQGGRPNGCGCGGCLLLFFVGFIVLSIVGAFIPQATPTAPLATVPPQAPPAPDIPLFLDPAKAAAVPLQLGLRDTAPGRTSWRQSPDGWYALASITTHIGKLAKVGDMDNTITCLHESKEADQIQRVTWTANAFNPDGHNATLPKFRELCLQYTSRLGCPTPPGLFQNVDPEKGQHLETPHASFLIEKLDYKQGIGWRYRITAK